MLSTQQPTASFFGKYDIRGIVGPDFGETDFRLIGRAYAHWLKAQHTQGPLWVAVGHDARLQSELFYEAVIDGLMTSGVSVVRVGLTPSPLVYFTEFWSHETTDTPVPQPLTGSLVITASHNPSEYNGVKFTHNRKPLKDTDLQAIKQRFLAQPGATGEKAEQTPWDVYSVYRQWCLNTFGQFKTSLKVVVDCGNATAGLIAPDVLSASGCTVVPLYAEPDGRFPNHHPDPCAHENLTDLICVVQEERADFGIAFDGDSDRLGVVDAKGRIIPGDFLLLLYVRDLIERTPVAERSSIRVVSEVKCSRHLFQEIRNLGASAILSATGHAYMKQAMSENNAQLGGELSGHFFFRDQHWGFDDAMYAALRLVALVDAYQIAHPGKSITNLVETLPPTCLSEERRVYFHASQRQAVMDTLKTVVQADRHYLGYPVELVELIDGVRVEFAGGFWLVRASNTETCLTLRCEAETPDALGELEQRLLAAVNAIVEQTPVIDD